MYEYWIIERTEYFAKAEPSCVLRDALPSDNAPERIELSLGAIVKLLKFILEGFLNAQVAV